MPRRRFVLLVVILAAVGCADEPADPGAEPPDDPAVSRAEALIRQAQRAHGTDTLRQSLVSFGFRGARFTARLDDGRFAYTREYADSTGAAVREVLTADTLYRTVDGRPVALSLRERRSAETAVNSVVYFALLPRALTDPAVQPRHLGPAVVAGEPYEEVEVTFRREGGGPDFEDRFVYWIHRERHTVDYLAYYYHTNEGGSRFRRAVNPRTVGGWRVQDYENYTADGLGPDDIERYDDALRDGGLRLLSQIELDEVRVQELGDGGVR
jgi:hypothetical protein